MNGPFPKIGQRKLEYPEKNHMTSERRGENWPLHHIVVSTQSEIACSV